jgi:hypothetical protein
MSGTPIQQAKSSLPLPLLMERLGLRQHARKSALCPFHEDQHNSFSVWQTDKGLFWKCHTGCGEGDEINFLEKLKGISRSEATKLYLEMADCMPPTVARPTQIFQTKRNNGSCLAPDWHQCVSSLTRPDLERLGSQRGYSIDFCDWLQTHELVGLYKDYIAFPVYNEVGAIVAVHYQLQDRSWRYYPVGAKVSPLVIGELVAGESVHVFESQWDAFAFMDVSGERSGVIITRGASNGRLVADVIPENAKVFLWMQNDAAGGKWAKDVCAHVKHNVKRVKIPAPHKDLNDWTRARATADDLLGAIVNAQVIRQLGRPLIEFKTPSQLKNFVPPPGIVLVGNCHIVRGSVFVIGGAPGVGKSRASVALAEAGAIGHEWFGLTVHRKFKTMIIQTENGPFRLKKEFSEMDCDALEAYVRICEPPPFGLCFGRDEFKTQLSAAIASFAPDAVIFDPWNAAARDEKARQYLETFDELRSVLPLGDNAPALGIVAHTRKPKTDERASGRALLNLLAGSYVLGSVPRTVFVMQAASDDTTDNRIVWTCCKNIDGELGQRSTWERRNGLFASVADFDWETFNVPDDGREAISEVDIAAIFENGALTRSDAVKALIDATGASRASCYRALKPNGRFAKQLHSESGKLKWLS